MCSFLRLVATRGLCALPLFLAQSGSRASFFFLPFQPLPLASLILDLPKTLVFLELMLVGGVVPSVLRHSLYFLTGTQPLNLIGQASFVTGEYHASCCRKRLREKKKDERHKVPRMAQRVVCTALCAAVPNVYAPLDQKRHVPMQQRPPIVLATSSSPPPRRWHWFGPRLELPDPPVDPNAPSPFVYAALSSGIRRRIKAEKKMQEYLYKARARLAHLLVQAPSQTPVAGMGDEHKQKQDDMQKYIAHEMNMMKDEIALQSQIISFGVWEPHAREVYLQQYGCVRWTEDALQRVRKLSPLIELGAGTGHWQQELTLRGADVLAFDNFSTPSPAAGNINNQAVVGKVAHGDESKIDQNRRRTLMLCYPPDDEFASRCLELYQGKWLVYIGEGRGGVNASPDFFDELEKNWVVHEVLELLPFPQCFERLYILRRRREGTE
jgi:hypothetical protein